MSKGKGRGFVKLHELRGQDLLRKFKDEQGNNDTTKVGGDDYQARVAEEVRANVEEIDISSVSSSAVYPMGGTLDDDLVGEKKPDSTGNKIEEPVSVPEEVRSELVPESIKPVDIAPSPILEEKVGRKEISLSEIKAWASAYPTKSERKAKRPKPATNGGADWFEGSQTPPTEPVSTPPPATTVSTPPAVSSRPTLPGLPYQPLPVSKDLPQEKTAIVRREDVVDSKQVEESFMKKMDIPTSAEPEAVRSSDVLEPAPVKGGGENGKHRWGVILSVAACLIMIVIIVVLGSLKRTEHNKHDTAVVPNSMDQAIIACVENLKVLNLEVKDAVTKCSDMEELVVK